MKLQNRFKEADKIRYWIDHPYCVLCGSNQGCALHHIDGCKQDYHRSIFNSAMLCDTCHRYADGHNTGSRQCDSYRRVLRNTTRDRIMAIGKTLDTYDQAYLDSCA